MIPIFPPSSLLRRLALVVSISAGVFASALPATESTISPVAARAAFDEAASLSRQDGRRLWGVELYGPLLLVERETRQVMANQPDAQAGLVAATDGVFTGEVPAELCCANTAVTWGGRRWTMVVWPLPEDPEERGSLLLHELFHRVQEGIGLPMKNAINDHLDTVDGRYWLRLEWRALARALRSSGQTRRVAVADALLFRAARRASLPAARENENALELNEGMAQYTGVATAYPVARRAEVAAAGVDLRERNSERLSPVRGFAYASGPAYGVLLDAARAPWRKGLGPASDLGSLLAKAYDAAPPVEPAAVASTRAASYDGAALRAEEVAREQQRQEAEARMRRQFLDGPRLLLPAVERFGYSFDPNGAKTLPGSGVVYPSAGVSDAWGNLAVKATGVLLEMKNGQVTGAVVTAPTDPAARPVVGAGWRLDLDPGWTLAPADRAGDWKVVKQPPAQGGGT